MKIEALFRIAVGKLKLPSMNYKQILGFIFCLVNCKRFRSNNSQVEVTLFWLSLV